MRESLLQSMDVNYKVQKEGRKELKHLNMEMEQWNAMLTEIENMLAGQNDENNIKSRSLNVDIEQITTMIFNIEQQRNNWITIINFTNLNLESIIEQMAENQQNLKKLRKQMTSFNE
ncbi:hypothetical protein RF11_03767 [Thelohanellus kitauei]|uniref:Uncharacterized protein n=1 Tax=Thelohanellus kitauei TaxID=669202 RepID=A0A0C2MQY7_THEKT|nr:hypothetical protein RF11_03767 [Thelohanellus kitauei]